jgi:predicted SprT family Zn-dependent metalloprotease
VKGDEFMYDYKNIDIINEKAKFYAKEIWDMEFNLPIIINPRLRSTLAQIYYNDKIEFNKNYKTLDEYIVDDTLLHELCHWYCNEVKIDHRDTSPPFEHELIRIGASSSRTLDYKDGKWIYHHKYYAYKCLKCGKEMKKSIFEFDDPHNTEWSWQGECCGQKMNIRGHIIEKEEFKPNYKLLALNNKYKEYYKKKLGISA